MPIIYRHRWAATNAKPMLPAMFDPLTGINFGTGIRYIVDDGYRLNMARQGHYAFADHFLIPECVGGSWSTMEVNFRGDDANFVMMKAVKTRNRLIPVLVSEGYSQADAEAAFSISLDADDCRMAFYHDLRPEVQRIKAENNKLTDGRVPDSEDNFDPTPTIEAAGARNATDWQ